MKRKDQYSSYDDLELSALIKYYLREKIILLSICFIGVLIGFIYWYNSPVKYTTTITLKNPPQNIFNLYAQKNQTQKFYLNSNDNINKFSLEDEYFTDKYNELLADNLLSLDNISFFFNNSEEFNDFKSLLKKKNMSAEDYFYSNFGLVSVKNPKFIMKNTYFLNYTTNFEGKIFLNKYVEFIIKKTLGEFKIYLHNQLLLEIEKLENEYLVSKILGIKEPVYDHDFLVDKKNFTKGTLVLEFEINVLKKKILTLKEDKFNYNFLFNKASVENTVRSSLFKITAFSLVLSLFLSIIFIYLKNINKK
jgi:LPS O-antigen subunit length determinant protein (WzzB/FepE family)